MKQFILILETFSICSAGELHIGVSQSSITPEIDTPIAGYYYDRGAKGVHDDLDTKAMVIEKDGLQSILLKGRT